MPPTDFYGKNSLTSAQGVKMGYMKKEDELELFEKTAHILIMPKKELEKLTHSDSIILGKEALKKGSWVCYKNPLRCTLS